MRRHLACAGWAVAGGLLCLAVVAWAQQAAGPTPTPAAPSAESWSDITLGQVVTWLGLPVTGGGFAWIVRGAIRDVAEAVRELVITIRLHDEDRDELRRARRALERHVDGSASDEGDPPKPKAAA